MTANPNQLFAPTPAPGCTSLSPKQLGMIHAHAAKAHLNDAQYRTILRSVAGVGSAKDLDQAKFEQVMAVIEEQGDLGTYWRERASGARANVQGPALAIANPRMLWKIRQLYEEYALLADAAGIEPLKVYALEGLVYKVSRNRTRLLEHLAPREAWNLIEQLKKIIDRTVNPAAPQRRRSKSQLPINQLPITAADPDACGEHSRTAPPLADAEIPF